MHKHSCSEMDGWLNWSVRKRFALQEIISFLNLSACSSVQRHVFAHVSPVAIVTKRGGVPCVFGKGAAYAHDTWECSISSEAKFAFGWMDG